MDNSNEKKKCILYDNRFCTGCGECEMCDLEPSKVCNSCGKCLNMDRDYNVVELDLNIEYTGSRDDFEEGELDGTVFENGAETDDYDDYGFDDYNDQTEFLDDYDDDPGSDDDNGDGGGYFGLDDFRR